MESNSYLLEYGDRVRTIRRSRHLSQVAFYNYLYPGNNKNEENIKKKMNAIENGKEHSLDLDFLLTMCHRCDLSADHIFGLDKDYSNHELKFVCEYTGLEENAVKKLHTWNKDRNNGADTSKIDEAFWGDEGEAEWHKMIDRQTGTQFLKILNYLFKEGERKNSRKPGGKEKYSNVRILHSLYLLCMSKPEQLLGTMLEDSLTKELLEQYPWMASEPKTVRLDGTKPLLLQDSSKTWYPIITKDLIEQMAKNKLSKDLDWLIEQVKSEEKD